MGTVTSGIDVVELAEFGGASDLVFDLIAVFVDQLCVELVDFFVPAGHIVTITIVGSLGICPNNSSSAFLKKAKAYFQCSSE